MNPRPMLPPGWDARLGALQLVDVATARAGEADAVEAGDTWDGLMRRAAGHLARTTVQLAGGGYGHRAVIVVGKGDNGGDGWAAAPLLAKAGMQVTVAAATGVAGEASPSTSANRAAWIAGGGRTRDGLEGLDELLASADVVVDALLGTGGRGVLSGAVEAAVLAITRASRPTIACDVPTGVDADLGQVTGAAVFADVTVTFGAVKRGLLLHPAAAHVGRLVVGSLGPRYPVPAQRWSALTASGAAPEQLPVDAEKRSRGVALAVVGASGASGAAALCTAGLQVGGAGLVTAAVPRAIVDVVAGLAPAAMTRALPHDAGVVSADAVGLLDDLDRFDVIVAGPGLQPTKGTRAIIDHLRDHDVPLVLDADALNVHREDPDVLAQHRGPLVITPHERELARLAGLEDLGDLRVGTAIALAARLRATVVAKGPRTVVAAPDGRVWVTPVGGPALASGGTGDVLAGMVAAAIARADDIPLAVARAVWQHGFAGHFSGRSKAQRLTADELARSVPIALGTLARLASSRPAWPLDAGPAPLETL